MTTQKTKLFAIFSFLSQAEVRKIHLLLEADKLHDEDLAHRLYNLLSSQANKINTLFNNSYTDDDFDNNLFGFVRYYNARGREGGDLYVNFSEYRTLVKSLSSSQYSEHSMKLRAPFQ